jgi:hypothetical protein
VEVFVAGQVGDLDLKQVVIVASDVVGSATRASLDLRRESAAKPLVS